MMKNYKIDLNYVGNSWVYCVFEYDEDRVLIDMYDGQFSYSSASLAAGAAEAWIRAKTEGPR